MIIKSKSSSVWIDKKLVIDSCILAFDESVSEKLHSIDGLSVFSVVFHNLFVLFIKHPGQFINRYEIQFSIFTVDNHPSIFLESIRVYDQILPKIFSLTNEI